MSVGPSGLPASIAGTQRAQTRGSETDRSAQQSSDRAREASMDRSAEDAAGIGETEQDQETSDRDADGRRIWETTGRDASEGDSPPEDETQGSPKDPHGDKGVNLDLSG